MLTLKELCRTTWLTLYSTMVVVAFTTPRPILAKKLPFEAVFQGLCEDSELCEQLCFNLHDGTFECDCQPGFILDANGYSCSKRNATKSGGGSILYEKEASFVAVLDEDYQGDDPSSGRGGAPLSHERRMQRREEENNEIYKQIYQKSSPHKSRYWGEPPDEEEDGSGGGAFPQMTGANFDRYEELQKLYGDDEEPDQEIYLEEVTEEEERERQGDHPLTSPGPNLEQKVPSQVPDLDATESLTPICQLRCGPGRCYTDGQGGIPKCQCPLGKSGKACSKDVKVETGKFFGSSWVAFAPLREAYRDVQLTLEFKPDLPNGVLLISGENDNLSGDFMAAILLNGYVEFRWDCGSGAGTVRSPKPVTMNDWHRITVYRHRWDVWLQVNNGHHVQGRSDGLFSRITFREPLYVGGTYNLTSLSGRLGVSSGFQGCIRRLQVNDHVYKFLKEEPDTRKELNSDYHAIDGWDIAECSEELCNEVECQHGGKCLGGSSQVTGAPSFSYPSSAFRPSGTSLVASPPLPVCVCPLGYSGEFCEKQFNLEVPSFNGTSLLIFPALGSTALSWLELEIVFKPSTDGVVLYAGHRSDGSSDFIALSLFQAHVLFNINLGSGSLTLRSLYPIRPNIWHTVRVSRTARRVWFYVDDQLPVEGITPGAFTMLTLSQPLYIGGLPPSDLPPPILTETSNFIGCVQKLSFGDQPTHLISGAISGSNIGSCDHPCSNRPCENGGLCDPRGPGYVCKCQLGYKDPHCTSKIVTQVATPSFSGRSFLKYTEQEILKRVSGDKLHIWLNFRSMAPDGLLLWVGTDGEEVTSEEMVIPPLGDSFSLELKDGYVLLRYNLGSGFGALLYNITDRLDDGEWHMIRVSRQQQRALLTVDDFPNLEVTSPGDLIQLNVDSPLYLGGREPFRSIRSGYMTPGLKGCLAELTLSTDYHVDLITQASAGQNIDYC